MTTPIGNRIITPVTTILPPVVPAKLGEYGFDKPEGTITPNGVRVWAIKRNAAGDPVQWVEGFGRDSVIAVTNMVNGIVPRTN